MYAEPKPTDEGAIAAGVPVFSRETALRRFLESVPEYVETVYVADNGREQDRDLYERAWPFDLDVLNLPFDCGIGACRAAIADASREPYLWVGDCDMKIARAGDLRTLRRVLESEPDLGGVSGWLLEGRAVRSGARDLRRVGATAIKEAAALEREHGPVPFVRADFIPQAGLFRTEVYEDYAYDPAVRSTEHFDFFYGHKEAGAWDFASTPAVVTIHNRDIDPQYRESERGSRHVDRDVLADKWGIERVEVGARSDWAEVHEHGLKSDAFNLLKQRTPPRVWLSVKRGLERVGVA
ncbi:MAG: hypothetical protein RI560_12900 [Natronomonas sp.]|nr:hypothetical protein [Natronomonas sp.]